jgi:hypothetical protein
MARCTNETPPLVEIEQSGRSVACWLHVGDPGVAVPVELSRSSPRASDSPAKEVSP